MISIAMYRSPAFAMQVKLRTAIAMGTRAPEIKALHQQHGFIHICFEYELAVLSACKNKEYSCGWNMIAAAVALDQPITSVFPKMNGPQDVAYKTLNTTIRPIAGATRLPI